MALQNVGAVPLVDDVLALQKQIDGSFDERHLAPGMVVAGKYEVERELAVGGVGVVVLARHIELGHRVAIKCLHPRFRDDRAIVERFKREARLAASIRSEHVVRVYDVGALEDGVPYMIMEYLEGEDLGAVVARGPVPIESAVAWLLQACEALAEAHAKGIVHRDLKPENLFLARRGGGAIVKVLDFGISKAALAGGDGPRLPRMTEENERFGTPLYMPPEQLVSSASADVRSDIWALGVVLYELLTAELPFQGADVPTIIANILSSTPVPLREKRPDAGPILDALVEACLSRDPRLRPGDIGDFTLILSSVLPDSSHRRRAVATAPEVMATPPLAWVPTMGAVPMVTETRLVAGVPETPSKPKRFAVLAATATVTLLTAVSAILIWSRGAPPAGIVQSAPPPADVTSAPGVEAPAVSADTIALDPGDLAPPVMDTLAEVIELAPSASADAGTKRPVAPARRAPARPPASANRVDYMEFGARR